MDAITDTNVYEPHQWKHSTIVAGVEWKNPVGFIVCIEWFVSKK